MRPPAGETLTERPPPHSLQEGLGEPSALLPAVGPPRSYSSDSVSMQSTLSVFSGGGWAGRGWGRLSPLSSSVGPLSLDRGEGEFGVSASGLVNIYDVLFCFLTMWRGKWIPTAKQVTSRP